MTASVSSKVLVLEVLGNHSFSSWINAPLLVEQIYSLWISRINLLSLRLVPYKFSLKLLLLFLYYPQKIYLKIQSKQNWSLFFFC